MSQQQIRIIDVSKTFTPVDPQIIEANRTSEGADARLDRSEGIVAYEGYNFLPTATGYKSFFGINQAIDIPACPAGVNVDKALIFESEDGSNHIIVLSDTGIYVNPADVSGAAWTHPIVFAAPAVGVHLLWTTCIIDDLLYAYQEGGLKYYSFARTYDGTAVTEVAPSFLNMEGQKGIFKAGGRLGFWDSESSVAWSSFDDHSDFVPSILTLAGSATFNEVRGAITTILTFGDGFIIYASNSIVYVARDLANTFQWNPSVLMAGSGVAYMNQVVSASPDTTHYCYSAIGLHEVTAGKIEPIAVVVTDMLRESLEPISLRLVENRYLCLELTDARMIDGYTEFDSVSYRNMGDLTPEQIEEVTALTTIVPLTSLAFT